MNRQPASSMDQPAKPDNDEPRVEGLRRLGAGRGMIPDLPYDDMPSTDPEANIIQSDSPGG